MLINWKKVAQRSRAHGIGKYIKKKKEQLLLLDRRNVFYPSNFPDPIISRSVIPMDRLFIEYLFSVVHVMCPDDLMAELFIMYNRPKNGSPELTSVRLEMGMRPHILVLLDKKSVLVRSSAGHQSFIDNLRDKFMLLVLDLIEIDRLFFCIPAEALYGGQLTIEKFNDRRDLLCT